MYLINVCRDAKFLKLLGCILFFKVGIAACQIARAYGLKVLGTASTEEGQKIVLENGAHKVFNHKEANYIDKIKVKLFYNFIKLTFCFMFFCNFFLSTTLLKLFVLPMCFKALINLKVEMSTFRTFTIISVLFIFTK